MIPHSLPTLDQCVLSSVRDTLLSGQVSMGVRVASFEKKFAGKFSLGHAAAVSSGTAGLYLALAALDAGPGDEVVLPTYVCTALWNAVHHAGARPVIADVGEDGNLTADGVRKKLSRKTKAVLVPHMFGFTADVRAIIKLGVPVIEDCAQSVGARDHGTYAGAQGAIGVFSFYATKMMTTGEGGMVASSDRRLIGKVRDLLVYDHKPDLKKRFNFKMSDIQAAMGLAQLQQLNRFIAHRRELAVQYSHLLEGAGVELPLARPSTAPVFFRYVVKVKSAGRVIGKMHKGGVCAERPLFRPLHAYLKMRGFPVADELMRTSVSLPIYPRLTKEAARKVADLFNRVCH